MLSNRESARRSRRRKQAHLGELQAQVGQLQRENQDLLKKLHSLHLSFNEVMRRNQVVKETMVLLRSQITSGVPISEKIFAAANAAISAGSVAEARLASEIIAGAVSPAVPAVLGCKEPAPALAGTQGVPSPAAWTPVPIPRDTYARDVPVVQSAGHPAGVPDQVAAGYSASASALLTRHDPSMSAATAAARAGYTGGVILGRSVAPGGVGVPATGQYATGQYAAGSPFVDGGGGGWVVDPNSVANVAGNVVGHGSHGGKGKGKGTAVGGGKRGGGRAGKKPSNFPTPARGRVGGSETSSLTHQTSIDTGDGGGARLSLDADAFAATMMSDGNRGVGLTGDADAPLDLHLPSAADHIAGQEAALAAAVSAQLRIPGSTPRRRVPRASASGSGSGSAVISAFPAAPAKPPPPPPPPPRAASATNRAPTNPAPDRGTAPGTARRRAGESDGNGQQQQSAHHEALDDAVAGDKIGGFENFLANAPILEHVEHDDVGLDVDDWLAERAAARRRSNPPRWGARRA